MEYNTNGNGQLPRATDSEEYVAACLWRFPDCADEVFSRLTPADFVDPAIRKIVATAHRQHFAGGIAPALLQLFARFVVSTCAIRSWPSR
jgi:hypothetical protein